MPVIARADGTRIPGPAEAPAIPAPVMIRRPAPRIVTNPAPSVVVQIIPAPVAIRRPIGSDVAWHPHPSVGRIPNPASVAGQLIRSIDIRARVTRSIAGPLAIAFIYPVAVRVPAIPIVQGDRT